MARNGKCSREMKQQAVAYFNGNQVPKQIEELLNRMFDDKPDDIYGYMAEYFGNHSKPPMISSISACEVLSSRGFSTLKVSMQCVIHGVTKPVAMMIPPIDTSPPPDALRPKPKTPDLKTKTPEQSKQHKMGGEAQQPTSSSCAEISVEVDIDHLIERTETAIAPLLTGLNPADQLAVDDALHGLLDQEGVVSRPVSAVETDAVSVDMPEKTEDEMQPGAQTTESKQEAHKKLSGPQESKHQSAVTKDLQSNTVSELAGEEVFRDYAVLSVSMLTAVAGATLQNRPLYEHLCRTAREEVPDAFTLPIPMVTVLSSGKYAAGKQNLIKEILVVPQPSVPVNKGLQQMTHIHQKLGNTLLQKIGSAGRCVTEDGSYSPPLDKPEQALDYVQDAVNASGYSLGSDVHVVLNCAATDIYDQEKMKYEVMTNAFKSTEDVINIYSELLDRYPGILAICDGIRAQDKEGSVRLNQRLGEKCFVIGNEVYRRSPGLLATGVEEKVTSGAVISLDQANTITSLVQKAKSVTDQGGHVVLSDGGATDTSTILVDLATAVGARFVKLGGPTRAEHVCKYRRLEEIERGLQMRGQLVASELHVFPVVNVVEEPEETGEEQENV